MAGSGGGNALARWLLLALSMLTLALALYAFGLPVVEVPRSHSQLPMLEGWWQLVRLHKLQPIAPWMQMLSLGCVALAAALAIVLSISRREDAGLRRLRRALALGAAAVLYLVVLRLWLTPGLPWPLLLDPLAFAAGAGGAIDLMAFLAAFPSEPRLKLVARHIERESQAPMRVPLLGRWRERANQALGSALARLVPALHGWPQDADAALDRSARMHHRLLKLMQRRRLWGGAVVFGGLFGSAWALTAGTPGNRLLGLGVALGVIPLTGFMGIGINYRFGDDDARRRIGWLYVLPTLTFVSCAAAWWAALLWLLLLGFDGAGRIAGMPAEVLWLASSLPFFPVAE